MGLGLALVVMLIGLVGSILPVLPGTPIVLATAIGHRLYFGAASINNAVLIALVVLTVVSLLFDFLATALGAKRFGATWRGAVGAVIGGVIGLFFSLPGIILGPFLGAMLFELLGGKEFKIAAKAGTFRDITSGNNGSYKAGSGWDACTGWGSPNGAAILQALGGTS